MAAAGTARSPSVLWVPNLSWGVDYFRHDGQLQDVVGNVFPTNKSSFLVGGGPALSVATGDAFYAPLAARQIVAARQASVQAAANDTVLDVATVYFNVQQARGELAGAIDAAARAADLVEKTKQLAPGLVPTVEINRAKTELSRRRLAIEAAYERWQLSSADLIRILRLDAAAVIHPIEEPHLRVELIDAGSSTEELIALGLTHRPELAAHQAAIQATLARIRQEKLRPWMPSLVLRGTASQTPGLSSGYFGGGINSDLSNFSGRNSMDLQAIWTFDNLGFGNRAAVRERQAESRIAQLELQRFQDRVMAEVVQAQARVKRASMRMELAEEGVRDAIESADKNVKGLGQARRVGEQVTLVLRPQEVVSSIAALDLAYREYYGAIADLNRGQFALYRALGNPSCALPGSVRLLAPVPVEMPK
ncbi:MAG: TolC family protein [Gemmataceae bacterium]